MNKILNILAKGKNSSGILLILIMVCLYFIFYAVRGERGLIRYFNLTKEVSKARALEQQYTIEKQEWDDKVRRLSSDSLDLDMLDEQARLVLNMVGEKEFVILDSDSGE